MGLDDRDRQVGFLIHDRHAKFPRAFDGLLASKNIKVIRTQRAPNANAHIIGRRQLAHVLRVYIQHYNREPPHRALDLKPPTREFTQLPERTRHHKYIR